MANTSEEFVNSTLDSSSPTVEDCLKGNQFGLLFYYIITSLCFLFSTPAHLWCLWFYFGTERKIKETQVFLLNHTIMEVIYCLECGTETLNMFIFNNDILWYVLYFFFGLSWIGRPLLQTCICIEQYMAVLHPVTFLRYKAIKYRIAVAVVAWLTAFAYGVYEINALIFPDYVITSVFIIAAAVVLFCCGSVLCALKHPGPGETHNSKQSKEGGNQQKRNAFNTIFSALLLILFSYLPQALLMVFTGSTVAPLLFNCTIVPFMISFNVIGVFITPFLKLYKEYHKKCLKYEKEIKVTA